MLWLVKEEKTCENKASEILDLKSKLWQAGTFYRGKNCDRKWNKKL
jgi:hypothetical protein